MDEEAKEGGKVDWRVWLLMLSGSFIVCMAMLVLIMKIFTYQG